MERNAIIGSILVLGALAFITYMTFWSNRIIERIAKKKLHSVRQILKDIQDD
ncbi:MAG: hypothetical protein ACMUIM_07860 [bacterium]